MEANDQTQIVLVQELETINDLYLKGDEVQKISVIQALPQLIQTDRNEAFLKLLPRIQQELPTASCEFQLTTSSIFRLLIEKQLPYNLIDSVLLGIESRDPIISNGWFETLLGVIPSLNIKVVKENVFRLAVDRSQTGNNIGIRLASCKLFGRITEHQHMSSFDVKKDILPVVLSLCQDLSIDVRTCICSQLPSIAEGLGSENIIRSSLLPSLVELASDESRFVRAAAVDAVCLIIPYLDNETVRDTIIPLVKQLCNLSTDPGDTTYPSIARVYGRILTNLQPNLITDDCTWFLHFFKDLSRRGTALLLSSSHDDDPVLGVSCRQYCAYSMPAVTYFTMTQVPSLLDVWYSIFKNLAHDPCYIVRRTIAGCIHEITRILDVNNKVIKVDIVKLLRDDAEDVLHTLVPNIGTTLELLCITALISAESTSQTTLELGRALLKCQVELFKGYNWRIKRIFLKQLERLPNCMPSDFIHQNFTPVLFNMLTETRAKPVRAQAARTLLVFLRYNIKEIHRRWIRENLISQLCFSDSCYTRHIFVEAIIHAADIFSNKYFKQHFLKPFLSLAEDPVATVRLSFVQTTPIVMKMFVLPAEKSLLTYMENLLYRLEMVEKDRPVIEVLHTALKKAAMSSAVTQDSAMEERRKIEEEEKIFQGKFTGIGAKLDHSPVRTSREQFKAKAKPSLHARPASTPTPKSSPVPAMNFLDETFVMSLSEDVKTPDDSLKETMSLLDSFKISTVSAETINVEQMTERDVKELQTLTTNITDDVKVNLQKFQSKLRVPNEKKRHSSGFPELPRNNAAFKRRSLHFNASEFSRIPVALSVERGMRKTKSTMNVSSAIDGEDSSKENQVPKRVSSLPVFIRRSQTAIKK